MQSVLSQNQGRVGRNRQQRRQQGQQGQQRQQRQQKLQADAAKQALGNLNDALNLKSICPLLIPLMGTICADEASDSSLTFIKAMCPILAPYMLKACEDVDLTIPQCTPCTCNPGQRAPERTSGQTT